MTINVFTYDDPKQWAQHTEYSRLQEGFHLCATRNMKDGIAECYADLTHIVTVREFLTCLFEEWYQSSTKLQQYLKLSKLLRDVKMVNTSLQRAFVTNCLDLLESMRSLTQSGLEPNHLIQATCEMTEKETEFAHVWHTFEKIDGGMVKHRELLREGITSAAKIREIFEQVTEQEVPLEKPLRIYLHGFYFITPEQQLMFEFLQRSGIELIFFQYYDARFPNTFDFIKNFIDDSFGWSSNWQIEQREPLLSGTAQKLLENYEMRKGQKVAASHRITKYPTFFDFLQHVIFTHYPLKREERTKDVAIFSTNATDMNSLLTTYYPELDTKNRNFLSYPVGRFLVNLHEVYQNGQFKLTEPLLMSMFSSGWLQDERTHENAANYTYDVKKIAPFFHGCDTLDGWLDRIEVLLQQLLTVNQQFKGADKSRVIKSMHSPFVKFSYYDVDAERVDQIKQFIIGIRILAEDLFITTQMSNSIDDHFTRLLKLVKKQQTKPNTVITKTERTLIHELEKKLEYISDSAEFLYDDVHSALQLYLSGQFDGNEDTIVRSFLEMDGEIFKKHDGPIYLTGLDERNLPIGRIDYPWPLHAETFEFLSEEHRALRHSVNRNACVKQTSRFLLFMALQFLPQEQLQLSWIESMQDAQDLNTSLYIRQLHMTVDVFSATKNIEPVEPLRLADFRQQTSTSEGWKSVNARDFLTEYALCPKRYYYSYIVEEYPVFEEDFVHRFLYTEIVKFTSFATKETDEKVIREVASLFPQWSRAEKDALARESLKFRYSQKSHEFIEQGSQITEVRKNFQFPGHKKDHREMLFATIDEQAMTFMQTLMDEENQTLTANPSYHCRFCPHKSYCPDVLYSVDE